MKIKVITTYKPDTWNDYAKRAVTSILKHWPKEVDVCVYHETQTQDIFEHPRVEWIDLHEAQPELVKFKQKHKNDPVANGELQEIPKGVHREGSGPGAIGKGSFLFQAVRFANKVFCVTHSIKTLNDYDYVVWLDADTYTFRPIPKNILEKLLPQDTLVTYLGREGIDPECGFVGYNLKHSHIKSFANDWEKIYISNEVFKLTWGWTDCSTLRHLINKLGKNAKVNNIGQAKGVQGTHVFINSELGLYIDHFKGKRKQMGTSVVNDLWTGSEATKLDYWKQVPISLPEKKK